jgi:hypothetical protein
MIDWFALVAGVAGAVVATVALVRTRAATRSADAAARDSRAAAEEGAASAAAAQRSAEAAETAAAAAVQTARVSREHEHDLLHPDPVVDFEFEAAPDADHSGQSTVVGSVTVPRDYRVYAEAIGDAARWPLNLPTLLRANQPYRFEIGQSSRELRLLFWPPDDGDGGDDENADVEAWACPCGRDAAYGDLDSPHWQWRAAVTPPGE